MPQTSTSPSALRPATWAAYAGSAGALGYAMLKLSWSFGGSIGVHGTPAWDRPGAPDGVLHFLAFEGTVVLAILAAGILLALVKPWGCRVRRPVRRLAWLGAALMLPVGLVGLATTIAEWIGLSAPGDDGGLALGVFGFVYGCFLVLGVAFAATAWLTRPGRHFTSRTARPPAEASPAPPSRPRMRAT